MTSSWTNWQSTGIGRSSVRWIKNQLNDQAWGVVISDPKSSWRPVASSVCQDSIVGPILLNIIIANGWWKRVHPHQLRRWYKTWRIGYFCRGSHCHPVESHEIQQGELQSPAPEGKELRAQIYDGPNGWRTPWQRRTLELWWTTSWLWASDAGRLTASCSWIRKSISSRSSKGIHPLYSVLVRLSLN